MPKFPKRPKNFDPSQTQSMILESEGLKRQMTVQELNQHSSGSGPADLPAE